MDFLAEWLKEIIIVVLIAVFIDLLLPNRAMERYVKFVVSLLILLTLLSPVLRIFSSDAKQKIETAFAGNWSDQDGGNTANSTEAILLQGEQLRKQQEAEALQWAGEEAARQMKEQIERTTGQPVERVTVTLTEEKAASKKDADTKTEGTGPSIKQVEVVMREVSEGSEQAEAVENRKIEIQPVEKVKVDIDGGSEGSVNSSDSKNLDPVTESDDIQASEAMAETENVISSNREDQLERRQLQSILEGKVEELLYREWGISPEFVTVKSGNGK